MSDLEAAAAAFQKTQDRYNEEFVKLADLLDEMAELLREYIALPYPDIDILIAVWIAGTYCYEKFQTYGYLALRSATPRCGKTRLLKLIARLCCGAPPITVNPTPATLYRTTRSVLILDEVDKLRNTDKEKYGEVMAVLCSGYEASGAVERMERNKGGNFEPRLFSTYGPKALAGIEALADIVADRSFAAQMVRAGKRPRRLSTRLFDPLAEGIRAKLAAWFDSYGEKIADLYADLPAELPVLAEFPDDRFQDCAEPLVLLASMADEERPSGTPILPRLLGGLRASAGRRLPTGTEGQFLAMLDILGEHLGTGTETFIATPDLLKICADHEDLSWIESSRRLSGFLKPFDLFPGHNPSKTARGYTVTADWLQTWRARYGNRNEVAE